MTQPVVFSASSVNAYQTCRLQWWFTYVMAFEPEPSEAMLTGIAVHEYAEWLLKRGKAAQSGVVLADTQPVLDPDIKPLGEVFERDVRPTYGTILLVEQEFQIEVNGIPFSGTVDSVDRHVMSWDDEVVVRDLKTTGSRPSSGKYRFNMVGYWLGIREMLGIRPVGLQLDYIVRTKKPYYWPEFQKAPDDDEIAAWAATLEIVAGAVGRGEYEPTGLGSSACSWCPHAARCGPYQRLHAISPLRESGEYQPPS